MVDTMVTSSSVEGYFYKSQIISAHVFIQINSRQITTTSLANPSYLYLMIRNSKRLSKFILFRMFFAWSISSLSTFLRSNSNWWWLLMTLTKSSPNSTSLNISSSSFSHASSETFTPRSDSSNRNSYFGVRIRIRLLMSSNSVCQIANDKIRSGGSSSMLIKETSSIII